MRRWGAGEAWLDRLYQPHPLRAAGEDLALATMVGRDRWTKWILRETVGAGAVIIGWIPGWICVRKRQKLGREAFTVSSSLSRSWQRASLVSSSPSGRQVRGRVSIARQISQAMLGATCMLNAGHWALLPVNKREGAPSRRHPRIVMEASTAPASTYVKVVR